MFRLILKLFTFFSLTWAVQASAAELVFFGSSACSVCERWEEEVGEVYPKTTESRVLPLRHHDIHDERPDELKFVRAVVYTPTFVAIDNGKEIGRIVGYMGDFFFWEQIDQLVKKLTPEKSANQSACPKSDTMPANARC